MKRSLLIWWAVQATVTVLALAAIWLDTSATVTGQLAVSAGVVLVSGFVAVAIID